MVIKIETCFYKCNSCNFLWFLTVSFENIKVSPNSQQSFIKVEFDNVWEKCNSNSDIYQGVSICQLIFLGLADSFHHSAIFLYSLIVIVSFENVSWNCLYSIYFLDKLKKGLFSKKLIHRFFCQVCIDCDSSNFLLKLKKHNCLRPTKGLKTRKMMKRFWL